MVTRHDMEVLVAQEKIAEALEGIRSALASIANSLVEAGIYEGYLDDADRGGQ
jgi:hypothetical protein